jgi:hypothetical protein
MPLSHLTDLSQEALVWISRFADRLRQIEPRFAAEDASHDANELARGAWQEARWRDHPPEIAAERWWSRVSTDFAFTAPGVLHRGPDGRSL